MSSWLSKRSKQKGDTQLSENRESASFDKARAPLVLLIGGDAQARRRGGQEGAKVPFLNAMICFLIVNMIQRRSYTLKASNI